MKYLNTILLILILIAAGVIAVHMFTQKSSVAPIQYRNDQVLVEENHNKDASTGKNQGFMYTNPDQKVPQEKWIQYHQFVDTYLTKTGEYYGGTTEFSNYICKNTGASPVISQAFFSEALDNTCQTGMVGCGGNYTRWAVSCGNQYFIEEWQGTSGGKFYGPFTLN